MSLELSDGMCACNSWALMIWHISGLTLYETSQYDLSAEQVNSKVLKCVYCKDPEWTEPSRAGLVVAFDSYTWGLN